MRTEETMMTTLRLIPAMTALALLLPATGATQTIDDLQGLSPEDRRAYVQSLSEEERKALAEQRRERWQSMSEEEREAAREQRRERWESLSDEEKAAMREQRREKRAQRREAWKGMSDEERAAARQKMRERHDGTRGHNRKPPRDDKQPGDGTQ